MLYKSVHQRLDIPRLIRAVLDEQAYPQTMDLLLMTKPNQRRYTIDATQPIDFRSYSVAVPRAKIALVQTRAPQPHWPHGSTIHSAHVSYFGSSHGFSFLTWFPSEVDLSGTDPILET